MPYIHTIKKYFKTVYYAIIKPQKLVLLEYPVTPTSGYSLQKPHSIVNNIVVKNIQQYKFLLQQALQHIAFFKSLTVVKKNNTMPYWVNNFLPGLDIIMLYTILDFYKPNNYFEIGCGNSTKVVHAYKQNINPNLNITCIDPNPRAEIKHLANCWINSNITNININTIKALKENDILFFDGSHVLYPNSDVMWFFLEILPHIPKGVIVQVHDIYLPYDYPDFMLKRFYNENYILASTIIANPHKFTILSPNFFISSMPELANILNPIWQAINKPQVEQHGGSFWFKIN